MANIVVSIPDVSCIALEDHDRDYTFVPIEYREVIRRAKENHEPFVTVRTMHGIEFDIEPETIKRMYLLDEHGRAKFWQRTEQEEMEREEALKQSRAIASIPGLDEPDDDGQIVDIVQPRPVGFR